MNTQHTPGPWIASCRHVGYKPGEVWNEEEFLQWEVEGPRCPWGRGDFFQADALLISAAPELLDAVNAMLTHMGMDEDEWNKPTFDQARAAIAKATGSEK